MSVELVLVRHGNTFGPGDEVVWVGKGQDLPLVASGHAQAEAFGRSLAGSDWAPTAALSGGLVRQVEHLSIALREITAPVPEQARVRALDEIDYGAWGGLTTEAIESSFGDDAVTAWNERSEWPADAGWPESRDEVVARVHGFANEIARGRRGPRVLACSSNGLMRWFLDLEAGGLERAVRAGDFKVRTGHACRLSWSDGAWRVTHWNVAPESAGAMFEAG